LLAVGSLFFWFSPNPMDAFSGWFLGGLQYQPEVHASWVPLLSVIATGVALGLVYRQVRRVEGFFEKTIFEKYSDRHPVWQQTYGRLRTLAAHDEATQHRTFFLITFQKVAVFCAQFDNRVLDAVVNGAGRVTVVLAHLIGWTDRHITDGGVRIVAGTARRAGHVVRLLQNGKIQSYFLVTFVSMLLLLLWVLLI
jgi:NADH-quinone oxidoreductase subunit L